MTYLDKERSVADGAPYLLLKLVRGSESWLHTTTEHSVVHASETYTPLAVSVGDLRQNDEDGTMSLNLFFPRDASFVAQFVSASAPTPVAVTVFRNHRGEVDGETKTVFLGQVSGIEFNTSQVTVYCTSLENAFVNPINRVAVQRTCAWMLYDAQCGADIAVHTRTATVATVTGVTVVVSGVTNSGAINKNGFIQFGEQRRFVVEQGGTSNFTLTLQVPFNPSPVPGDTVLLIDGCDRTVTICDSRFKNSDRFGGFTLMPQRSPWDRLV